jgi:preprotein translocase subunit SecY
MSFTGGDLTLTETQGLALLIAFVTMVAGGYVLAWRAKRTASRGLGSLLIVVVAGLLGLFFLAQAIGALTEPPPEGSRWGLILAIPVLLAIPTVCFVIAAIFIRRTLRYRADGKKSP